EPPETSTTETGGTTAGAVSRPAGSVAPPARSVSDIAFQGLLHRDLVPQLDRPRRRVLRQPGRRPALQLRLVDRAVGHDLGRAHLAHQGRVASVDPRPGHGRVGEQHVAYRTGGDLRAADIDLVAVPPAGDEHAAVDDLDLVAGADRAAEPGPG